MHDTIVGYTYQAENLCPSTMHALLMGPIEFPHPLMSLDAEPLLDLIAAWLGVDRDDEHSFDSGDFPKRIREGQVDTDERCVCGDLLVES